MQSLTEFVWLISYPQLRRLKLRFPLWVPEDPHRLFHTFPLHPLLDQLIYAHWDHPAKHFLPPKKFLLLYPMEEEFTKEWSVPAGYAAISCVNKSLTCTVDNVQVFRDPVDKTGILRSRLLWLVQ